jgi:hypothetical protein
MLHYSDGMPAACVYPKSTTTLSLLEYDLGLFRIPIVISGVVPTRSAVTNLQHIGAHSRVSLSI